MRGIISMTAMLACAVALGAEPPREGAFFEEKVVCPEGGPYPMSHGSTLVELPDGALVCAWYAGSAGKAPDVAIVSSRLEPGATAWTAPAVAVDTPEKSDGNPVLYLDADTGTLWLFFATMYGSGEGPSQPGTGWTTCKVKAVTSTDGGKSWSPERILIDEQGYLTRNKPLRLEDGTIVLPIQDERDWTSLMLISKDHGATWAMSKKIDAKLGFGKGNIGPALVQLRDGGILCLMRTGSERYKTWHSISNDGGQSWSDPVEIEVPNPGAALDLVRLESGNVVMALNPVPGGDRERLSLWLSTDDGHKWHAFRDVAVGPGQNSYPSMIQAKDGSIHLTFTRPSGGIKHVKVNEAWVWEPALINKDYYLANVVASVQERGRGRAAGESAPNEWPMVKDEPFKEHVRARMTEAEQQAAEKLFAGRPDISDLEFNPPIDPQTVTSRVARGQVTFVGTTEGLYRGQGTKLERHAHYGVDGPLSSRISALAHDSSGALWIAGPRGLTVIDAAGNWRYVTGKEGLPVEDVTAIAIDENGNFWFGTSYGAIHYRPSDDERQWYYRAGRRYLIDDNISAVALAPGGMPAYFKTDAGISRIDAVERTLEEKSEIMEARLNKFHRRLGLVCACTLDDAEDPTTSFIIDDDNDGLWTSYHVVAMSLAYAATGDEAYKESAKTGMHALVMLQNASGTPGLVARSVIPTEDGLRKREEAKNEERLDRREQWRPTPDGTMYWKSDTSSDEIDGHYFAFYAYWRHIAQFDPVERALIEKQVRDVTDYIVGNGYVLMDWDGERTTWGYWSPEIVNGDLGHYGDNGLNSLEILSFLKTAHYITGDPKYKESYEYLICDHNYLSNVMLEKKVFPDSNNHSDNQLGYVAWYPLLQLEWDPKIREALHRSVRRHYRIVAPERSSFFDFVSATIDPYFVDVEGAVQTLRDVPTDRRLWAMRNSHRADVQFQVRPNRHGDPVITRVLPADERHFNRWNIDPFVPDGGGDIDQHVAGVPTAQHNVRGFGPKVGGDGRTEDDGGSWLLAYWIGRYHGFINGGHE